MAFADGRRFVRRLVPAQMRGQNTRLAADAVYVVTGGTGALGTVSVRWLVDRGARAVALLARGTPDAHTQPLIDELRAEGADVYIENADVSSRESLDHALDRIRARGLPIRGLLHCAGVLRDGPVIGLRETDLMEVTDPKVRGAAHVLELTERDPLDWIVWYSSAASVLGSPGQAAYCAANSVLDAIADDSAGSDRHVHSISWGPWAKEGMASTVDWSLRTGVAAFDPARAVELLDAVVGSATRHVLALPFDVRDLLQFFPAGLGLRLFDEIYSMDARQLRSSGQASTPMSRPTLANDYVAPRNDVERYIASRWQAAVGIDRVGVFDGFFELGGDSVFANQIIIEVNREFGVTLNADQVFADFTVARIAELTADALRGVIESMSEEDVLRQLADPPTEAQP